MQLKGCAAVSLTAAIVWAGAAAVASAALPMRVIVRSGDPIDALPGSNFDFLGGPTINNSGQVAFNATGTAPASGGGTTGGVWTVAPGMTRIPVVAASRFQASPAAGLSWESFDITGIDDAGNVAFVATTRTGSSSLSTIWSNRPGPVTLVARKDDLPGRVGPLAGVPLGFERFLVNRNGDIAFSTTQYQGGTELDRRGVWRWDGSGNTVVVAREGDVPPPALGGAYTGILETSAALNDQGVVQFHGVGNISGGSGDARALLRQTPPGPPVIAALNAQSAGAVGTLGPPEQGINSNNDALYAGTLTGSAIRNGYVLWRGEGTNHLVARSGDPAAGAPGTTYLISNAPVGLLTGARTVAFSAALAGGGVVTGQNDAGLWLGTPEDLQLIARRGDPVNGMPVPFTWMGWSNLAANARGDLLFRGTIRDDVTTLAGVWVRTIEGDFLSIVRAGEELDVDPGPGVSMKTVSSFSFASGGGGEDGMPSSFSESGHLALKLFFTDSSTALVVTAIPEPTTMAPLALAAAGLFRRRRA